ncbi:MAG TPA: phosphate:sodium symporter [Cryomorphaceae bacterium]|jgi:phosphate/sulfate permease|nr:phosphate:sodium symporter [Cryomorphaceae bacterium]
MDPYFLLVVLLMALAVLDLVVGVSNDAVNFMNSAIGSRAASFRVILAVASFGVLLGTMFSSGMMEVARKGVFDPGYFTFHSLMFLFVAVMLTDVILLDIYNSLGFPTSTTVSLVFELFGAGTAIGFLTSIERGLDPLSFGDYLNVDSTLRIISGIFSSVGVAFVGGLLVQWLTRMIVTYRLERGLRLAGGIFTGIATTLIVNFLIFKGLKGSVLMGGPYGYWLLSHQNQSLAVLFVLFSVLGQVAVLRGINPLRYVVLLGTFSLAMAFAGNDLVNFIGVSVAAFQAYQLYQSVGFDPRTYSMDAMAEQVSAPFILLLLAGLVMIATLWLSAKARKVSETQIGLARQGEGAEKFKPNTVSRSLTQFFVYIGSLASFLVSRRMATWTDSRFAQDRVTNPRDAQAFDFLRASVDLMVASTLIAYATSLGLPLSTTFVVFMVGMGSSLADRAWGKESAVYRVAGVVNVIGGWLLTAVIAFVTSAIFAAFIYYGEFIAALILTVFALGLVVRSHMGFAEQMKAENLLDDVVERLANSDAPMEQSRRLMASDLHRTADVVVMASEALAGNHKRTTARLRREMKLLLKRQESLELRMVRILKDFKGDGTAAFRSHLLAFDYVSDMSVSAQSLVNAQYDHLMNLHERPHGTFLLAYAEAITLFSAYSARIVQALETGTGEPHAELLAAKRRILQDIQRAIDWALQHYRQGEISTRQARLQSKLLMELRDVTALMYRVHRVYFG